MAEDIKRNLLAPPLYKACAPGEQPPEGRVGWYGGARVPNIGEKVICRNTRRTPGVVRAYWVAGQYLGVELQIAGEADRALVFGPEIMVHQ